MKKTRLLIVSGIAAALAAILVIFAKPIYKALSPRPVEEADLAGFTVRGFDISAHNGSVDFERAVAQGFRFVFMKTSEGSDFRDTAFVGNIRRAHKAGLKVGVYHFFRFDSDGYLQALNLLHSIRGREIDLPLVVDLEEWGNPQVDVPTVTERLDDMLTTLVGFGGSVMIYTNKEGYYRYVRGRFDGYPLWLCSFSEIDRSIPWTFWQYTHRGHVDGTYSFFDLDIFRGDSIQWNAWTAAHRFSTQ